MSDDAATPTAEATRIAEEILTTLYGEDYQDCPVSLSEIALIIQGGMNREMGAIKDLLTSFQKVIEAVRLLSTPPDTTEIESPQELQSLLSERLDGIRALADKTNEAIGNLRQNPPGPA